jgi:uncharacterized protein (DUF1501 family)
MATFDRRQFLAGALTSGVAAAATRVRVPHLIDLDADITDATTAAGPLVFCTLFGGNDGLNTVIPYELGTYYDWRGDLAIPKDQVLPIGSHNDHAFGFHPSMTGLQSLFNAGKVAVIHGVEYPNPNFSHFQSTTIWQTANFTDDASSGFLGRWLDETGSNPLRALSVGPTLPQALVGNVQQASTLADSTSGGSQLPWQLSSDDPTFRNAYRGIMKTYRGQVPLQAAIARAGANVITVGDDADKALTKETPPAGVTDRNAGDIGNQFDIVAECIEYGLATDAYGVTFGSFDTHADQLNIHAGLLTQLDAAIQNFMAVFPTAKSHKSPVIVVVSEFGRTPKVNSASGTDHATESKVLVIGPGVKGGHYGTVPSFTKLDEYGFQNYTTDFRSVYATVLEDVLEADAERILGGSFRKLGFV